MRAGPGDSNAGPVGGDRRTAERSWQGQSNDVTDTSVARRTGRAPTVTGVVELDLSRHADQGGYVHSDARATVHRVLVALPAGVAVRVRLGRTTWVANGVLDLLAELVADAASVEVVGTDDRGVAHVVPRLRDRLEVGA